MRWQLRVAGQKIAVEIVHPVHDTPPRHGLEHLQRSVRQRRGQFAAIKLDGVANGARRGEQRAVKSDVDRLQRVLINHRGVENQKHHQCSQYPQR